MAKLTGAKKKAFLERMEKGRRKAARANPKKKATRKKRKPAKTSNPRKISSLGPKALQAIRVNLHLRDREKYPDEYVRSAAKEYVNDGGKLSDLMPRKQAKKKNPTVRKPAKKKRAAAHHNPARKKKRRNSDGAADAARMFETFHQMPPNSLTK